MKSNGTLSPIKENISIELDLSPSKNNFQSNDVVKELLTLVSSHSINLPHNLEKKVGHFKEYKTQTNIKLRSMNPEEDELKKMKVKLNDAEF